MFPHRAFVCTAVVTVLLLASASAWATPIQSLFTVLGDPTISNFEGFAEGLNVSGPPGIVTFSQPFVGGPPMIDNAPFLDGYVASSGMGVLTGTSRGAAINATFVAARSAVEIFLSDTSPQGNYAISAFGTGGILLETFIVQSSPGLGLLLPGDTTPRSGLYVGFIRPSADIVRFGIGHAGGPLDDAFALDDLRAAPVPEPPSILLVAAGLLGIRFACRGRRRGFSRQCLVVPSGAGR